MMTTEFLNNIFLLNLFDHIPPVFSYFLCCMGAIFSGIVVGKEREKAQKAAGLRTFAMVALGSCVFTLTSRMFSDLHVLIDSARIPAQIVSGVGFLGAGAVFRSGRVVSGLTTAAGIWATAAVGLVFGMGFFAFGLSITFMIYCLLGFHTFLEKRTLFAHIWNFYLIHVDAKDGKGPILIGEIVREWGHHVQVEDCPQNNQNIQVWKVRLSPLHRPHQRFLSDLAVQSYVLKIENEGTRMITE